MTDRQEADGFDRGVELSKRMRREAAQAKGHTPKPWYAEKLEDDSWVIYPKGDEGFICSFDGPDKTDRAPDEVKANAHVMKAAPDLLEALEAARRVLVEDEDYKTYNPVVKACDAAIKRAKGAA